MKKKKIIKNDPKFYLWRLVVFFLLSVIVFFLTWTAWYLLLQKTGVSIFSISNNFLRLIIILSLTLILLITIMNYFLYQKKRTIEVTKDYVVFPESKFFKNKFSKKKVVKIKVLIPKAWRIDRYLTGTGAGFKVVHEESGKIKETSQAIYADFNPEKIVEVLKEFGYKVEEDHKKYFITEQ